MPDLETLLRETLSERAETVQPRSAAVEAAAAAVRRRRRWRQGGLAAGAAAAAAVVTLGAVTLWPHPAAWTPGPAASSVTSSWASVPASTPSVGAPAVPPTTTAASVSSPTGNPSGDRYFLMNSLYGGDFEKRVLSSGFSGDIVLKDGSPSSVGLPDGYSAALALGIDDATTVDYDGTTRSTIVVYCRPLVEKGATTKACVPYDYQGRSVQRLAIDAPNTKIGTWAASRMLWVRPDGKVQMTTMTVFNTTRPTSAHDRDLVAAWLNAQSDKLAALTTAEQR